MYFRRNDGKVSYTKGEPGILLEEDAAVYLDTYFNGFSIGKWRKYTRIEQVNLTLRFRGKARVTLLWNERSRGQVIKHYLEEKVLESDGGEVSLPFWESGCMGIYSRAGGYRTVRRILLDRAQGGADGQRPAGPGYLYVPAGRICKKKYGASRKNNI